MKELPDVIQDFLQKLRDELRAPAYLLVNESNILIDWGGDLASYGITDLKKGDDVGAQVPFLAELPPFNKEVLCLPCIQTAVDSYVDVYLFLQQQEIWVLLMDVTNAALEQQRVQQRSNNLALEVAALKREKESLLKIIADLKRSRT
jgi:hypothetical protein